MKVRFAPKYLSTFSGGLSIEGIKLKNEYLSKGGRYPDFFSILLPLLTAGFDERECPPAILPVLRELKDRGYVVEAEEKKPSRHEDINALIKAKTAAILGQLEKTHKITSANRDGILKAELRSSFDESELKYGNDVLLVLHGISKTLNARVVLAVDFGGKFRGIECAVPSAIAAKIRLSNLVNDASRIHHCLSEVDKRIRSDQLTRAPDHIQGSFVMTQTRSAKVYMISRLNSSPRKYVLIITTAPDISDARIIPATKHSIEKLDLLLK